MVPHVMQEYMFCLLYTSDVYKRQIVDMGEKDMSEKILEYYNDVFSLSLIHIY